VSAIGGGGLGGVGAGAFLAELEEPQTPQRPGRRRGRPRVWRVVILTAAVIFFLGPLVAAAKYSLIQQNG